MERGKVKCHKYWPKKAGEIQTWGAFSVKNIGETLTEDHFIRQTLEVSYQCQSRTIYHYKFTQVSQRECVLNEDLSEFIYIKTVNKSLFYSGLISAFQRARECYSISRITLVSFMGRLKIRWNQSTIHLFLLMKTLLRLHPLWSIVQPALAVQVQYHSSEMKKFSSFTILLIMIFSSWNMTCCAF